MQVITIPQKVAAKKNAAIKAEIIRPIYDCYNKLPLEINSAVLSHTEN
jgi:hypothetical protein